MGEDFEERRGRNLPPSSKNKTPGILVAQR
jgi:hypothetical protein